MIAGGGDEALPDAGIPQIGPGRQRSEESDAAPARREIRSDKRALVIFRGESRQVLGPEPAIDIVEVAPELLRSGAVKSAKGNPDDPLCLGQIGLGERANNGHELLPARIDGS